MELNENDIVISGISGRFPKSNNVREFAYNLFNKIDMVDDDESRWKHFIQNVPKRFGKIRNLEKFDASFFSTLNKHANWTDPQMRMLLEHAYEAVLDAGISPQSLAGSKTGVFVASSASEAKEVFTHRVPAKDGYIILGNANFYLSNRISYALGLCGPSFTIDAACSSSAYALDCAFHYMETGLCDAALVGGSQLILTNGLEEYTKLGVLALDGISRPFDEKASGFVRAETICVVFLQKAKDSKRVYANLVYSSSNNDGFKKEGTSFPSRIMQQKLMEDFYQKVAVNPIKINFVEAHSTGTRLGDPEEVASIDDVFTKDRKRSRELIIGSVKSNMGHAEAASGMSSLAKVLIAFEHQKFPSNIHLTNPRKDIEAFSEGRIKVAIEIEELEGEYIAMNSFGLGGANAHALLRGNTKVKVNSGIPDDNLGRMLLWSGRTESAINSIFDDITERSLDAEYVALLQNTQTITTASNTYRGYGMFINDLTSNKAVCTKRNIQYFNGTRRPVVFVYSGIGSQWIEMGRDLMKIPMFAETIDHCHNLLQCKGIDLKKIITSVDVNTYSNVMNSYVGIIAIEIALTNILKALGVVPDFIIGHSVGEIGCAYADGCFNVEEALYAAYARGEASFQSKTVLGAMAAVGLNHKCLEQILPENIDIACHNADDSTTISGPADSVNQVVEEFKNEKIFAKTVDSSGIALHSRYIIDMGKKLNEKLKEVIKIPKQRSQKWLSSTYPEDMCTEEEAQYSSAEYHTKNLLNPVLFLEVCERLPKNSLTIEVAPHGLLKAILKRNLKDGVHISLTQKACGVEYFMESLGSLFQNGIDMDISKLFPPITFPVSRGTPMISPVIKWNHEIDHFVPYYDTYNTFERSNMIINISDKNFDFMQGNIIDGQYHFSESGWIVLVWEIFSKMIGAHFEQVKVVFEDINFVRASPMAKNQDTLITIAFHRGTGRFEVIEDNEALLYGYIKQVDEIEMSEITVEDNGTILADNDFYKEMRIKGYFYMNKFQSVKEVRHDGLQGKIKWIYLWHTFLDGMFQVAQKKCSKLTRPIKIRKLVIDPIKQHQMIDQQWTTEVDIPEILLDVTTCPYFNIIQSGGIEIHDMTTIQVNKKRQKKPILEDHSFIPFFSDTIYSIKDAAKIITQTAMVNISQFKCTFLELDSIITQKQPLSEFFSEALRQNPHVVSDVTLITSKENIQMENVQISKEDLEDFSAIDMILACDCISNKEFLKATKSVLNINGYIISRENKEYNYIPCDDMQLVLKVRTENEIFNMLQFKDESNTFNPKAIIEISSKVSDWLEPLKAAVKNGPTLIYGYNQEPNGIMGFMNSIRREYSIDNLKCFFIMDTENAPIFDINHPFYKSQLELNHIINIFKNGEWGNYRHIDMKMNEEIRPQNEHCVADCIIENNLSSLKWFNGSIDLDDLERDVVKASYVAINKNYFDLLLGSENSSSSDTKHLLGQEFSGIDSKGQKVMGITLKSSKISTHYKEKDVISWDVPKYWNLEEAATVPLAYFITYFAFFKITKIQYGESILVHSGSSDLGQTAIQVALVYGLDVFTTVETEENKQFLKERFSKLKVDSIATLSQKMTFERMIMKVTNGKGINYVFNPLSNHNLEASIRCLSQNGVLLQIGEHDLSNMDMSFFKKNIAVKSIQLDDFILNYEAQKTIHDLIDKDLKSGIIKPLSSKVFHANQLQESIDYASNNRNAYKVLLKIRQNESDSFSLPIAVSKRIYFKSHESVIIAGGLGGIGLELTDFLVSRGCKNLVLSSSRGIKNAYQQQKIESLKSRGVTVMISTSNIATEDGCFELLSEAIKLGPVSAIFNLAAVLRDGIFENLDIKMFDESLAPKGPATLYLDKLSRKLCSKLRHFVVFSSISSGRGYAGKGNYGLANSLMERIAEKRREAGYPGTAIQWGAIGDVGMLEDFQMKFIDDQYIGGMYPQTLTSCLEVFDALITSDSPVVSSFVIADKGTDDLKKRNIVDIIFNIMGIRDKKSVSLNATFNQLGIDSLMGVEIQQVLEREYDLVLTSQEIRSMTISQLERLASMKGSGNIFGNPVSRVEESEKVKGIKLTIHDIVDLETFDPSQIIVKANNIEASEGTKILILPWIFGFATKAYKNLAKSMEYPAYILQLSAISDYTNLDELAFKLTPHILEIFNDSDNIFLIGHSFGALLGLKIAKNLENNRKFSHLIEIDGSPQFTPRLSRQMLVKGYFGDIKDYISMLLCEHLKLQINPVVSEKSNDWEAETRKMLSDLSNQKESMYEHLLEILPSAFTNRLNISLGTKEMEFSHLKSTKISLIKPTTSEINGIHRDYGLSQYTSQSVKIKFVKCDHWSMINNSELLEAVKELIL